MEQVTKKPKGKNIIPTKQRLVFSRVMLLTISLGAVILSSILIYFFQSQPSRNLYGLSKNSFSFLDNNRPSVTRESTTAAKESSKAASFKKPDEEKPVYSGFCLKVPVLLYHHIEPMDIANKAGHGYLTVSPDAFEGQMSYLASSGYRTISADELVSALRNKTPLPAKTVVVTIDDGYKDNYTFAYPILYKYHLVANMMIATGLLGNPDYMSWDDLQAMSGSGLIFMYDHTWSHASLAALPDDKMKSEILTAKKQLEEKLGKSINIFTYPYGSYNAKVETTLLSNGFTGAFSTIPGFTQCDSFIMNLHRNRIGNASLRSYGI